MTIQQQWNEYQHTLSTSEECLDRAIEMAVERAIYGARSGAHRQYADGLGNIQEVPERINFDPF